MDFFKLDTGNRFTEIEHYDGYESAIWTDRWASYGDFEVVGESSDQFDAVFSMMNYVSLKGSDRIGRVYEREDYIDDDGRSMSKASGRSLESRLEYVNLVPLTQGGPIYYVREDTVYNMARRLSYEARGHLAYPSTLYFEPNPSLPPTGTPNVTFDIGPLYPTLQTLCDQENLGFRIKRYEDNTPGRHLHFEILTPRENNKIYYSAGIGNFINESQLISVYDYRSYVTVIDNPANNRITVQNPYPVPAGFNDGYGNGSQLLVHATDIENGSAFPTFAAIQSALRARGLQELTKHTVSHIVDGEVTASSKSYGVDYQLGDWVTVLTKDRVLRRALITEYIWSDDGEGPKEFPTVFIDNDV